MKGKIAIVGGGRHSLLTAVQLNEAYQQGRADAIDELFNAEIINGMTLKDVYEEASTNEFDEGWNRCYEDFVEVAEQLKEQNNE